MSHPTKAELQERIQKTKKILKPIFKNYTGHPDPDVRNIVSEIIEAIGALDGKSEHDV